MSAVADIANPVIALSVKTPKGFETFNVLLDTGAQFNLLDFKSLYRYGVTGTQCQKSIVGLGVKDIIEGIMFKTEVILPSSASAHVEFFCPHSLRFEMQVEGINKSIEQLSSSNIPVSSNLPKYSNDSVTIVGVLGNDILQHFQVFEFSSVKECKLLRLTNGYVPIGSIKSLLAEISKIPLVSVEGYKGNYSTSQFPCKNRFSCLAECEVGPPSGNQSENNIVDMEVKPTSSDRSSRVPLKCTVPCNKRKSKQRSRVKKNSILVPAKYKSSVNFVLQPKHNYYSPLKAVFPESEVEQGRENLFALESIGISNEKGSSYDDREMESFQNSITFSNGKYGIDIPWNRDILKNVPSNFELAKILAKKVSFKNAALDADYWNVFVQQQELDIIKEIPKPGCPCQHIWIPHRPVIKTDPLVCNTKIRPVYNCSLKVGNAPSVNEAAYPGTDLLNDLLGLVLYFRSNDFVVLADIAKAFLNIRLNKEEDRRRFSFVIYHQGQFRYFYFNTILFGFISSPFILNYIIRYHSQFCENKVVGQILRDKLYVDNLVYTGCDIETVNVNSSCVRESLAGAGFLLREWCSNNAQILEHLDPISKPIEIIKLLGYTYYPDRDAITLKKFQVSSQAKYKRQILGTISSIFDPLGFIAPCMVGAKLFMRKLGHCKISWDEQLSTTLISEWKKLSVGFNKVFEDNELLINRKVAVEAKPAKITIFTDASKEAYGFAAYLIQSDD